MPPDSSNIRSKRLRAPLPSVTYPWSGFEEISFGAPEQSGKSLRIDAAYVKSRLDPVLKDEDLSRYIL